MAMDEFDLAAAASYRLWMSACHCATSGLKILRSVSKLHYPCIHSRLIPQLPQQHMAAIIPRLQRLVNLVRLINRIDGRLHVPEMVDGDIVPRPAELALEADAAGIVGARGRGVEGGPALWVRVVVVVVEVARPVVVPPGHGVDETRGIQLTHAVREAEFGVRRFAELAPAFVVDYVGHDAGEVALLDDEQVQLAFEFGLLLGVGEDGDAGAVVEGFGARAEGWHVLDHKDADFIARLHEMGSLWTIQEVLTCLRSILNPSFFSVPESLIQRSKLEHELAVEQRPLDPVNFAAAHCTEPGVACDTVSAHGNMKVVQRWRVWRP
ncbi:hypothetical protein KC361_g8 [Hortaea werneckii]|nr:hypothetical protein KC361_g8 [Hortaea werneckii]